MSFMPGLHPFVIPNTERPENADELASSPERRIARPDSYIRMYQTAFCPNEMSVNMKSLIIAMEIHFNIKIIMEKSIPTQSHRATGVLILTK